MVKRPCGRKSQWAPQELEVSVVGAQSGAVKPSCDEHVGGQVKVRLQTPVGPGFCMFVCSKIISWTFILVIQTSWGKKSVFIFKLESDFTE